MTSEGVVGVDANPDPKRHISVSPRIELILRWLRSDQDGGEGRTNLTAHWCSAQDLDEDAMEGVFIVDIETTVVDAETRRGAGGWEQTIEVPVEHATALRDYLTFMLERIGDGTL
jgi:hypothetical protein